MSGDNLATEVIDIAEEDRLRAHFYGFLARLLAAAPNADFLQDCARLSGDNSDMGQALNRLAEAAQNVRPDALDEEFHALFIGVGRGELVPFGSYYMAGFLNEKPLAKLREDLARLGIERADNVYEPEDHIASVSEIMGGLIEGRFGSPLSLQEQARFFAVHIGPWAETFFSDLEAAENADFYIAVGAVGRLFMSIETTAFQMVEDTP